jgi:carbon-monoxide dehydrogenase medium subunit
VLGACVTHADIEDGRVPDVTNGAMRDVAAGIAYRAVRNRGTIGGSLTMPIPRRIGCPRCAALGAEVTLRGPGGGARLRSRISSSARSKPRSRGRAARSRPFPRLSAARWGYVKKCRKTGEFAHAIGAVLIDPSAASARRDRRDESRPIVLAMRASCSAERIAGDSPRVSMPACADRICSKAGMTDPLDRQIHVVTCGARPRRRMQ